MYTTSANYKTAMRAASRPYDTVYGTVTLTSGAIINIDSSVIPANSISISKQCVDGGELMFGGVFLSTLNIALITDLDRYVFYGAVVDLTYKILVAENTYEEVPLGIYTVADAERPSNIVKLTAYDNMRLLDKDLGGLTLSGTPWEVFSEIATQTGYPLAFTESDLSSFRNTTYQLQISEEQGIKTFRGAVKAVCQQLGCFAVDSRLGTLALKDFSLTADITLGFDAWYSIVPADYTCNYVALSITSLQGTYVSSSQDPNLVGNVMVVEDSPAWDFGSVEASQAKADNLFAYLTELDYTPADIDMPGDPSVDCGDRLNLSLRDGTTISTLITSYEWNFHNGMSVISEGINPYLDGGSAIATESARILSQAVERSRLQFIRFTNSVEKIIETTETKEIGKTTFTPTTTTNALFVATILVDVEVADTSTSTSEIVIVPITAYDAQGQETVVTDLQGNVLTLAGVAQNSYTYLRDGKSQISIFYTLNDVRVPNSTSPYTAVEKLEKGRHIITVSYPLSDMVAYQRYNFQIFMTVNGGTVTLPAHTLQATIIGQEITTIGGFSGEISAEDNIYLASLYHIGVLTLSEGTVNVRFTDPTLSVDVTVVDTINNGNINYLNTLSLQDSFNILMEGKFPMLSEGGEELYTQDGLRFITE